MCIKLFITGGYSAACKCGEGIAFWNSYFMNSIAHLPLSEQQHFTLCDTCSAWVDMRNLEAVFEHLHISRKIKAEWSASRKLGKEELFQNKNVCTNPRLHRRINTAVIRKLNHHLKRINHN